MKIIHIVPQHCVAPAPDIFFLQFLYQNADDKNNNANDFVHKFENCTEVLPSTGDITTIENGTCFYLKSHNKFFVTEYQPRRMKRTWQVQISPDCKLLRIQFHDLFGIAGNPYMNCEGKLIIFYIENSICTGYV